MSSRRMKPLSQTSQALLVTASLTLAIGCNMYKARSAFDAGNFEASAKLYHATLQSNPTNLKARIGYQRAAARASEQHLEAARDAERHGKDDVVEREVRAAYRMDPSNAAAQEWIVRLELAAQKRAKQQDDEESSLEDQRIRAQAKSPILLNPRSLEGMDLNFSRKTSLRDVFAAISKNSGVSIILHNSFKDDQISADLRGLTFQRILDTLMLQSDLFYKVIDANTIMVFKDSPTLRNQNENQLIQTFYLSNANVDEVKNVLSTLMENRVKVVPNKQLNALTLKAKLTDLTIAKRIVNSLDKARAEVMVYVELLEVTENQLERVGLLPVTSATDYSGLYRMGATLDVGNFVNHTSGTMRFNKSDIQYIFPSLALDALKSNGDGKLVASPNVRVVSGEKAEVNIGEKISTTQSSIGNLGTASTSSSTSSMSSLANGLIGQTQYAYEDVGVKISVEPRVHFNDDITLTISATISTLKSGSVAGRPDMGKRDIKTVARLKDGETVVFGGLLKDEEQKSLQGIWGLTDVPILGKLLGNTYRNRAKTDVIMTLRTVLVRKPDLREEDFEAFDPERASAEAGPFTPKPSKIKAPTTEAREEAISTPSAHLQEKAPTRSEATSTPTGPGEETKVGAQTPANLPANTSTSAPANAGTATAQEGASQDAQDLVLFLTPLSSTLKPQEHLQLTLMASGGRGLSSGDIDLQIDPRLKLISINGGDFITNEGGTVESNLRREGGATIHFKRATTASDSGTVAVIEVEALKAGNAPVLIQSGKYLVGTNPIPAKVVNALVTVE